MNVVHRWNNTGQISIGKIIDFAQTGPFRGNCVALVSDKAFGVLCCDAVACWKGDVQKPLGLNLLLVPGAPPVFADSTLDEQTVVLVEPHNLVHTCSTASPHMRMTGITYF